MTWAMTCQRGAPSAAAASRSASGTSCSMSSVVRTTTGMTMMRQRHGAGQAGEMAHRHHHDFIDEQADDDGRRAQQDVVDEADDRREPIVTAVFRQIGAGQHADRRADEDRQAGHDQAADDGIGQTARRPGGGVFR